MEPFFEIGILSRLFSSSGGGGSRFVLFFGGSGIFGE